MGVTTATATAVSTSRTMVGSATSKYPAVSPRPSLNVAHRHPPCPLCPCHPRAPRAPSLRPQRPPRSCLPRPFFILQGKLRPCLARPARYWPELSPSPGAPVLGRNAGPHDLALLDPLCTAPFFPCKVGTFLPLVLLGLDFS
jgi:hypothetical protein